MATDESACCCRLCDVIVQGDEKQINLQNIMCSIYETKHIYSSPMLIIKLYQRFSDKLGVSVWYGLSQRVAKIHLNSA